MFKFSVGSFGAFSIFDDLVFRKRLVVERNGRNLDLRGKSLVYIEYFCLLSVQGQFRVIQCISNFCQPCISKTASRRAKWTKFGHQGQVLSVYRVLLTVKCSRSAWGHSVHFRFFADLVHVVSQKRLIIERNEPKFWAPGVII